MSATDTLNASVYDKANVDIPSDGSWVTVELAPAVPDALLLLIIKADPAGAQLTFRVNDNTAPELPLNRPQLFSGAAGLLSANPVERLLFKNAGNAAVNVDITMARYASAPAANGDGGEGGDGGDGGDPYAAATEAGVATTEETTPPASDTDATAEATGEGGADTAAGRAPSGIGRQAAEPRPLASPARSRRGPRPWFGRSPPSPSLCYRRPHRPARRPDVRRRHGLARYG